MPQFTFDVDMEQQVAMTNEPVPPGEYNIKLLGYEVKQSKAKQPGDFEGTYLNTKYGIHGGEYDGRIIFDNVGLPMAGDPKKDFKAGLLKGFMLCFGFPLRGGSFDPQDGLGLVGRALIKTEKKMNSDDLQNKVGAYLFEKA